MEGEVGSDCSLQLVGHAIQDAEGVQMPQQWGHDSEIGQSPDFIVPPIVVNTPYSRGGRDGG